jgi:hypothetical protein
MQSVYWRKCRLCLRWFRRAALVAVVVLICAFVWCDRVGVPDFLKRRLVESLRERGVELEFSRMRYILFRGLIAENVRVGHAAETDGPAFSAGEVRLELDNPAMLHGRLQLDGLMLNRGRFVLPLSPTNALQLDDIRPNCVFRGTTHGRLTTSRPVSRARNLLCPAMLPTRRKSVAGKFSAAPKPAKA